MTLAHGGGKMPARILEAAGAMAWPMWPALAPEDVLLAPAAPPEGFSEYLESMGLRAPRFATAASLPAVNVVVEETGAARGRLSPEKLPVSALPFGPMRFTPFGWNDAAVAKGNASGGAGPHPDPVVVRRVNSRAFGLELERAVSGVEACPATFCPTEKSVRAWLAAAAPGTYVAKGNHGLAGIGQARFEITAGRDGERDGAESLRVLADMLTRLAARHGGVVFEEALRVTREWGVLFRLGRGGGRSSIRRHRLLSGDAGGYAGALVLPNTYCATV